ncbi:MAG: hypothetical protein RRY23_07440 [Alistipes sp.]
MAEEKGFTIDVSSKFEGWWRYNIALMCGCFNAVGERIGFVSTEAHVADVGANLKTKPAEVAADRKASLHTPPCDNIVLYIYLIPHTLPVDRAVDECRPFDMDLRICHNGHPLRTTKYPINQWSGASFELKIEHGQQNEK